MIELTYSQFISYSLYLLIGIIVARIYEEGFYFHIKVCIASWIGFFLWFFFHMLIWPIALWRLIQIKNMKDEEE